MHDDLRVRIEVTLGQKRMVGTIEELELPPGFDEKLIKMVKDMINDIQKDDEIE